MEKLSLKQIAEVIKLYKEGMSTPALYYKPSIKTAQSFWKENVKQLLTLLKQPLLL